LFGDSLAGAVESVLVLVGGGGHGFGTRSRNSDGWLIQIMYLSEGAREERLHPYDRIGP